MKTPQEKRNDSLVRLIDIVDAGIRIGLGKWRVRTLIYSGKIPYVRLGRRIMIDIRDIDAFIEANKTREGKR